MFYYFSSLVKWFWTAYMTPGRPGRATTQTELNWIYLAWLGAFLLKMLGSTALEAVRRGVTGKVPSPITELPGPEIHATLPPRRRDLIRDYVRFCGGEPNSYKHTVPPHMWPQWGLHKTQVWMYLANLAYGVTTTRDPQTAKIGREMREALSTMLSDVMLAAAESVEAACPVQTGHLVSNFILSTGSPYSGVDGSPDAVSYDAQNRGKDKIAKYDVGRDGRIHLTNNVPYLAQQPPFVTEALMAGVAAAPRGRKTQVRRALKSMAKAALRRGA